MESTIRSRQVSKTSHQLLQIVASNILKTWYLLQPKHTMTHWWHQVHPGALLIILCKYLSIVSHVATLGCKRKIWYTRRKQATFSTKINSQKPKLATSKMIIEQRAMMIKTKTQLSEPFSSFKMQKSTFFRRRTNTKTKWRNGSKTRHSRMDLGSKMQPTMRPQHLNRASKPPLFHSIRLAIMQLQAGQMDSSEGVKIQIVRLKVDLVTLLWSEMKKIWKVTLEIYREKRWKKGLSSQRKSWRHSLNATGIWKKVMTRTRLTILGKKTIARDVLRRETTFMIRMTRLGHKLLKTKLKNLKNNLRQCSKAKKKKALSLSRTKISWVSD